MSNGWEVKFDKKSENCDTTMFCQKKQKKNQNTNNTIGKGKKVLNDMQWITVGEFTFIGVPNMINCADSVGAVQELNKIV